MLRLRVNLHHGDHSRDRFVFAQGDQLIAHITKAGLALERTPQENTGTIKTVLPGLSKPCRLNYILCTEFTKATSFQA